MLLYLTIAPPKQTVYPINKYKKKVIVKRDNKKGEFIF